MEFTASHSWRCTDIELTVGTHSKLGLRLVSVPPRLVLAGLYRFLSLLAGTQKY